MNQTQLWHQEAELRGWTMPAAPRWKRLPGVRHVRAIALSIMVDMHNRNWRGLGMIPTGYDEWVIFGIWIGEEVDP